VRLSNTTLGPVEVSTDRGRTWHLIGRVVKPALERAPGAESTLPAVARASGYGLAFGVGGGHQVRLLPDTAANRRDPSAIVVNLPVGEGLFKELLPAAGTRVQTLVGERAAPLPTDYRPQDGDRLLLTAPTGPAVGEGLQEIARKVAEKYRSAAVARLRAEKRKPTTGILSLNVSLAKGDQAGAVTYYLNGAVIAIQNQGPFSLRVDTRRWGNGEHLLEVRALDQNGSTLTYRKVLLVVDNPVSGPAQADFQPR
jgi:hypothetical protein